METIFSEAPQAGPRPITIQQYKLRNTNVNITPPPPQKKMLVGKEKRSSAKFSNLHRLANLTTNKFEKSLVMSEDG